MRRRIRLPLWLLLPLGLLVVVLVAIIVGHFIPVNGTST